MLVAAGGLPGWRLFGLILLAMVFARTAAMVFNRVADWEIDKLNPRTASRHQLMSRPAALALLVASTAGFIVATWFINPLCFLLSPIALANCLFLLADQALHRFHPVLPRAGPGGFPSRRLASRDGSIRLAAAHPRRRRALLGGRFRSDLRNDGSRFRSAIRPALDGGAPWALRAVCGSRPGSTSPCSCC